MFENGSELKTQREEFGVTQDEFAEAYGVNVTLVSKWENGHRTLPAHIRQTGLETLKKIAQKNLNQTLAKAGEIGAKLAGVG